MLNQVQHDGVFVIAGLTRNLIKYLQDSDLRQNDNELL